MTRRRGTSLCKVILLALGLGIAASQPATADAVNAGNPALVPLKWSGLYRFKQPDGIYHCTAQFITARVILLAAHCLRDINTGKFYDPNNDRSIFFLQYQNDEYTKAYRPVCSGTLNGYVVPLHDGEDLSKPDTMSAARKKEYQATYEQHWQFDYGFVLLDSDSISGHYNYRINVIANSATSTGYPGEMMSGEVIQFIKGDVIKAADLTTYQKDTNVQVLWHGNPALTQGSSGGAWVANFSHDESPDTNIVIGLNSFGSTNRPGASFGPMFTDNFQKLLTFVSNGCR